MSKFVFGQRSLDRLNGVNTRLVSVVHRALELSTVDFTVVEGLRSKERQAQLYAQGRTTAGKIVTWTLKSKHMAGSEPITWRLVIGRMILGSATTTVAGIVLLTIPNIHPVALLAIGSALGIAGSQVIESYVKRRAGE